LQFYEQYDTLNKKWQVRVMSKIISLFIMIMHFQPLHLLTAWSIWLMKVLMLNKHSDLHLRYKSKPQNVEWQNIWHWMLYHLQRLFSIKPYKWPVKISENWKIWTGNSHSLQGISKTKENLSQKCSVPADNQTMHFLNTSQQYYSMSQRCGLKSFATTWCQN
jgi:hypothetical protein